MKERFGEFGNESKGNGKSLFTFERIANFILQVFERVVKFIFNFFNIILIIFASILGFILLRFYLELLGVPGMLVV